jgi:hypothetical protein
MAQATPILHPPCPDDETRFSRGNLERLWHLDATCIPEPRVETRGV